MFTCKALKPIYKDVTMPRAMPILTPIINVIAAAFDAPLRCGFGRTQLMQTHTMTLIRHFLYLFALYKSKRRACPFSLPPTDVVCCGHMTGSVGVFILIRIIGKQFSSYSSLVYGGRAHQFSANAHMYIDCQCRQPSESISCVWISVERGHKETGIFCRTHILSYCHNCFLAIEIITTILAEF